MRSVTACWSEARFESYSPSIVHSCNDGLTSSQRAAHNPTYLVRDLRRSWQDPG